jgi:uncharacterized protein YabE (DUF348 family)
MGIKANIIIKPEEQIAPRSTSVEAEQVQAPVQEADKSAVIVDGKVKKISKKSAFLLDMLSLDD